MNFVITNITKFNQSYIYNIDVDKIKEYIKMCANDNNYIHNIDTPIEEQELPIDTQFNYIKIIEYFYGNIIIEIGFCIYYYKIYKDIELSCNIPKYDSNEYIVEIPKFDLIYEYKIVDTINCKNCTTNYIIENINKKIIEHNIYSL
jgi:hypothetical protein